MITRNYLLGLLDKNSYGTGDSLKRGSNDKTSFPEFKNVLNNTVSQRATVGNSDSSSFENISKMKKNQNREIDKTEKFKSFNDASRIKKQEIKSKKDSVDTVEEQDEKGAKKGKKAKEQGDSVIQALAGIFGVNAGDMSKILAAANVNPEELAGGSSQDASNKLAELMGLSDDQKKTLEDIMKVLTSQLNAVGNGGEEQPGDKENWVKVENPNIEVVDLNEQKRQLSEIMAKFKSNLKDLGTRIQQEPGKTLDEIASGIKGLLEREENQNAVVEDNIFDTDASKEYEEAVKEAKEAREPNKENSQNPNNGETDSMAAEIKPLSGQVAPKQDIVKSEDNHQIQFNSVDGNKDIKGTPAGEVIRAPREVPVSKSEILNQVVDKAKVILNSDKSEMIMQLKPESLGKLSLKIVTERGIVMAKFVAENEQVKAVLESNMQMLKDTLEKQGLSVQGFSVSVGQDSQRDFNNNRELWGDTDSNGNKSNSTGLKIGEVEGYDLDETGQKNNPYNWSDSKINITA